VRVSSKRTTLAMALSQQTRIPTVAKIILGNRTNIASSLERYLAIETTVSSVQSAGPPTASAVPLRWIPACPDGRSSTGSMPVSATYNIDQLIESAARRASGHSRRFGPVEMSAVPSLSGGKQTYSKLHNTGSTLTRHWWRGELQGASRRLQNFPRQYPPSDHTYAPSCAGFGGALRRPFGPAPVTGDTWLGARTH
jgi:hypothetical protein